MKYDFETKIKAILSENALKLIAETNGEINRHWRDRVRMWERYYNMHGEVGLDGTPETEVRVRLRIQRRSISFVFFVVFFDPHKTSLNLHFFEGKRGSFCVFNKSERRIKARLFMKPPLQDPLYVGLCISPPLGGEGGCD